MELIIVVALIQAIQFQRQEKDLPRKFSAITLRLSQQFGWTYLHALLQERIISPND